MTARLSIIAACASAALAVTGCGANPVTDQKATTVSTSTTTSEVPGADPTAWFEAYCGPMGVAALASRDLLGLGAAGTAAVKDAVVRWASLAATSDRKIADDVEKLGPLGSDVQSLHERLVKQLRKDAEGFDRVSARLLALEANDVFLERYQQVVAVEMGNAGEQAKALFTQIVSVPKYNETFRVNKVCADWLNVVKQLPRK